MSNAQIFDIEATLERVENDGQLLLELFELFFEDYDDQIYSLQKAISGGDGKTVEGIAHSIKSALGNLGAMVCFSNALQMEHAGREGNSDSWQGLLDELQESVKLFEEVFNSKREEIGAIS